MITIRVIGIGAGNPDHMTMQAIGALNQCDVVLVPRKGDEKADLAELRREICRRFLTSPTSRIVEFDLPKRDAGSKEYLDTVDDWHDAIAEAYRDLLAAELGGEGSAGLLVWGDPSLYDSTLRILERLRTTHAMAFATDVVPGITAIQALCASHAIPLNAIGAPVLVTTGRRLREGLGEDVDTVVVMLDGENSFTTLPPRDFEIFWGAYLGLEAEILVSGPLADVSERIVETRRLERARHGWIMDTYLLRRKR